MTKILRYLVQTTLLLSLATGLAIAQGETDSSMAVTPKGETELYNEIDWILYDTGLVAAKNDEKHVLINFTTSWCGWCKKMEKETFSKPDVIKLVADNFVAIKVDGDSKKELNIDGFKITEKNLAKREYGVRGYPSFCFLNSEGTKLGCFSGYRDKKTMIQYLNYIKNGDYDTTQTQSPEKGSK
ncbi:MAG: thioredoxin family protein [candidate division Zixibacteria bacterium]|nr:thioredoxin family protein [candidate division Zixibacteria bacterium]